MLWAVVLLLKEDVSLPYLDMLSVSAPKTKEMERQLAGDYFKLWSVLDLCLQLKVLLSEVISQNIKLFLNTCSGIPCLDFILNFQQITTNFFQLIIGSGYKEFFLSASLRIWKKYEVFQTSWMAR